MSTRPTPINEEAAYKQLCDEFESVMGKPVDEMAAMICRISTKRAMTEEWRWVKQESKNWSAILEWL